MKEYTLTAEVTISVYTKVKANSLDEAIEIAAERNIERAQWGQEHIAYESWLSDDYDGEVTNIKES